jgi:hypothetical protein
MFSIAELLEDYDRLMHYQLFLLTALLCQTTIAFRMYSNNEKAKLKENFYKK